MLCVHAGAYLVSLCGLDEEVTGILVDFLFALEPCVYKRHRRSKLPVHHKALMEAITMMELFFPTAWCTIVRHYAGHVLEKGGLIALGGVASATSMLSGERYNTLLRKLAHSTKNMTEGIARAYSLIQPVAEERLLRPENFTLPPPARSVAACVTPMYMEEGIIIKLGRQGAREYYLDCDEPYYRCLVFLWRQLVPRLDAMIGWHDTQVHHGCRVPFGEWAPAPNTQHSRSMTEVDRLLIHPCRGVWEYPRFWLNGVLFRTEQEDEGMATTNCGVEVDYLPAGSLVKQVAYGKIQKIVRHQLYEHPKSPVKVALKIEWYPKVGDIWSGRAAVVRKDTTHPWNNPDGGPQYVFCEGVRRNNVAFWPLEKIDPTADPRDMVVIRRNQGLDE